MVGRLLAVSRPRVLVTAELPTPVRARIDAAFDAVDAPLRKVGAEMFLEIAQGADAIVAAPGDPFDAALIRALPPTVRVIASYSTGLDHIDLDAAAARSLPVTGTPDVLTAATADTALALILLTVRGLRRAMQLIEEDRWTGWAPAQIFGRSLEGRTLGLVGGGRIAAALAARAAACGMRIAYWSRSASADLDRSGIRHAELHDLLAAADIVSLHVPSTAATRDIIDARALDAMKSNAVLINTGRGDLVDDDALVVALRERRIAGAGLDVFRGEPRIDPRYREVDNVVLLPHVGSATVEARDAMGELVLASLRRHLATCAA